MTNNPAEKTNNILKENAPQIFELLSNYGKRAFFPSQGILAQTAEAKSKAYRYNATIGIATEENQAMALKSVAEQINHTNYDYLKYAPSQGIKELREKWKSLLIEKNPSLKNQNFSLPLIVNGLTHGVYLAMRLFLNKKETVLTSNYYWGNYKLIFKNAKNLNIATYKLFDEKGNFNHKDFDNVLLEQSKQTDKITILLNFPNNPTGYSLLKSDANSLISTIKKYASQGKRIIVFCDDAYFGLFFEEKLAFESLFAQLSNLDKNILAIKIDGATKEDYAWGLRCAFVTFASKDASSEVYKALEEKLAGIVRANISNASHLSQKIILNSLNHPDYQLFKKKKFEIIKNRYQEVKKFFATNREYQKYFSPLPFNSGYFMAIEIKNHLNAEEMRQTLLKEEGIGVIALGEKTLRIAFSCLEQSDIQDLFERIVKVFQSYG